VLLGTDSDFLITPGPGFYIGMLLLLCVLAGGVVTALKGRWGWLAIGFLIGGTPWLFSAFLAASPNSAWARRA
jgi:hypothetical protein